MTLSIIIPTHNEAKNIVNCLRSIYSQAVDISQFQVVVVDDASNDNTFDLVDKFAQNIDNLILVKSYKNFGCGQARNTGFRISSGDYIWCVDADDVIADGALQKIIDKLKYGNLDCLYLNFQTDTGKWIRRHVSNIEHLSKTAIGPWCRIYRREFYVDFPDYRPEDVVPFYLMIDKVKTVDSIDDVCYIWNTSNPSAMTRNFDFCKNHRHSLFEYATMNIMNKNNKDDRWISGIMKMLTHMYEIRNELKNPIVKQAWTDKFKKECDMVFNNGQFCH